MGNRERCVWEEREEEKGEHARRDPETYRVVQQRVTGGVVGVCV